MSADIIAPAKKKTMGERLRGYFLTGVFVTAPIVITLYIAYAFFTFIDAQAHKLFPNLNSIVIYDGVTVPGLGVVAAFIAFVIIGWFASNILGRFFIRIGEYILDRIPVIRDLYSAIKQIFETIATSQSQAFREVVMIEYPRKGVWSIGFVTGSSKGEVQERVSEDTINVFLPTTPNPTSGFLLFVARKEAKFLDMTVEEGIKLVVSAGIITPPHKKSKTKAKSADVKIKAPKKSKKVTTKKASAQKTALKKIVSKKAPAKTVTKKAVSKKSAEK